MQTKTKHKHKHNMQTILVVYTNTLLTKRESQTLKRYSFNTSEALSVGDMFSSDQYTTCCQVVDVLKKTYKYVDLKTGKLSNTKDETLTGQVEIRELYIRQQQTNKIEIELL